MKDESRAAAPSQILHPAQPPSTELFVQVVKYVIDHLHTDIAASVLSKRFSLKESVLLPAFQLHTGIALDEFVLRRRIERALDLLKNTNSTDGEIAVCVGWGTAPAFQSAFSNYLGLSPTEYRRSLPRNSRLRVWKDKSADESLPPRCEKIRVTHCARTSTPNVNDTDKVE